ncbi:hypothetical protein [Pseudomonas veronii]
MTNKYADINDQYHRKHFQKILNPDHQEYNKKGARYKPITENELRVKVNEMTGYSFQEIQKLEKDFGWTLLDILQMHSGNEEEIHTEIDNDTLYRRINRLL